MNKLALIICSIVFWMAAPMPFIDSWKEVPALDGIAICALIGVSFAGIIVEALNLAKEDALQHKDSK